MEKKIGMEAQTFLSSFLPPSLPPSLFSVVLGFEHRALHLLGLLAHPQPFCCYFVSQKGLFPLGSASSQDPPTSASHVGGVTGMHHHSWLVFEMESW
jgi:hypothetical protein